jgi:hypothetical protein
VATPGSLGYHASIGSLIQGNRTYINGYDCNRGGVRRVALVAGGLALPEGATSTAIHVLAIGCFTGAFVLMVRDFARRERGRRS